VAETVDQYIIRVPQSVKPALIRAVLEEKGADRVIVFARTRGRADTCCKKLRRAGYAVESIHSDRSQNQRRRALDKFAKGEVNIITATDVLARGIDVDQVDYVVNYDAPEQAEDYIHRIGRTGRAGKEGFAVTFVTPETEGELRAIEKLVKRSIPEMKLANFDLAAAEAEAAERSINAQSKRDPEVNRAKRELANKAAKKEQARQNAEQSKPAKQGPGRKQRKRKPASAANAPARNAAQPRKKPVQPKHDVQPKGDNRPGRAHRAEVQRARSRKHR